MKAIYFITRRQNIKTELTARPDFAGKREKYEMLFIYCIANIFNMFDGKCIQHLFLLRFISI